MRKPIRLFSDWQTWRHQRSTHWHPHEPIIYYELIVGINQTGKDNRVEPLTIVNAPSLPQTLDGHKLANKSAVSMMEVPSGCEAACIVLPHVEDNWEVRHFILAFGKDHDLYFFQDVRDSIMQNSEGEIEAPAVLPVGEVVKCHSELQSGH